MRLKKHIVCWLCLLLLITTACVTVAGAAETETTAASGVVLEDLPIFIPADATAVENSAAKELQTYLQKITGTKVSVWKEMSGYSSGIFIGATELAADNHVTYPDRNGMGEGWAIEVTGKKVIIAGGADRGVLYGV